MLESRTMFLDARLRRLTTYLYVQDLLAGAHVLEVGSESGGDFLRARGAKSVGRAAADGLGALPAGEFDVAFALDVEAADSATVAAAMRRVVKAEGTVVLAVPSRDRPGARAGASYYELVDLLRADVPVGEDDRAGAVRRRDAGRVRRRRSRSGARRHAGAQGRAGRVVRRRRRAQARAARGYGVMQVPLGEVAALPAERRTAPAPEPRARRRRCPAGAPVRRPSRCRRRSRRPTDEELKAQLAAAHKGKTELQEFVLEAAGASWPSATPTSPSSTASGASSGELREQARRAEARADKAEAAERETRKRLAEAEGTIVRLRAGGSCRRRRRWRAAAPPPTSRRCRRELEKWKQKEARRARRGVEGAQAARGRRGGRGRGARGHGAQAQGRAQAGVGRADARDRRGHEEGGDAQGGAGARRARAQGAAASRSSGSAPSWTTSATAAAARAGQLAAEAGGDAVGDMRLRAVNALERELMNADAIAAADRARSAQLIADLEPRRRSAPTRAVRVRHSLREREREVAALRHELSERDARLTALEQRTPPSDEVERLEAELTVARARVSARRCRSWRAKRRRSSARRRRRRTSARAPSAWWPRSGTRSRRWRRRGRARPTPSGSSTWRASGSAGWSSSCAARRSGVGALEQAVQARGRELAQRTRQLTKHGRRMGMTELRVGVVGLGPIGLEVARAIVARRELQIVAAVDVSPALARQAARGAGAGRAGRRRHRPARSTRRWCPGASRRSRLTTTSRFAGIVRRSGDGDRGGACTWSRPARSCRRRRSIPQTWARLDDHARHADVTAARHRRQSRVRDGSAAAAARRRLRLGGAGARRSRGRRGQAARAAAQEGRRRAHARGVRARRGRAAHSATSGCASRRC